MPGKAPTTAPDAWRRASYPSSRRQRAVAAGQGAGAGTPTVSVAGTRHRVEAAFADGCAVALSCDPTLEGVLGAVGIGYLAHADEARVRLVAREACQPRFGEAVVDAPRDGDDEMVALARRVVTTNEELSTPTNLHSPFAPTHLCHMDQRALATLVYPSLLLSLGRSFSL